MCLIKVENGFMMISMKKFILKRNFMNIIKMGMVFVLMKILCSIRIFKFWSNFLNIVNVRKFFMRIYFLLYIRKFI